MIRKIIHIDTDACTGCGLCAEACHEGAIQMIDGKAILTREDYCDGLGDCLPACPAGAISFVEREAPAYDHAAVQKAKKGPGIRRLWRQPLCLSLGCLPFLIRQRRPEPGRTGRRSRLPVPVAGADQTCAHPRPLFCQCRPVDRSGLHRFFLW